MKATIELKLKKCFKIKVKVVWQFNKLLAWKLFMLKLFGCVFLGLGIWNSERENKALKINLSKSSCSMFSLFKGGGLLLFFRAFLELRFAQLLLLRREIKNKMSNYLKLNSNSTMISKEIIPRSITGKPLSPSSQTSST